MTKRRNISGTTIETNILAKCARRCCVCYGLNGDREEKRGQIAHLDHDPTNSAIDNLVYLCFEHHDQYDSQTSQSKSLTMGEVKLYRAQLHEAIARMRDTSFASESQAIIGSGDRSNRNEDDLTLEELLYSKLDGVDREVLRAIMESNDLAGASLDMLSKQLDITTKRISSSLEKMEKLGVIYETWHSEHGVFYDIDRLKGETVVSSHYPSSEELPLTRFLRIDYITGYYPDETPRFILEGYDSQRIVIRLRDMESLLNHLVYFVSNEKKEELKRENKKYLE